MRPRFLMSMALVYALAAGVSPNMPMLREPEPRGPKEKPRDKTESDLEQIEKAKQRRERRALKIKVQP